MEGFNKKILLITPLSFYSFGLYIAEEFRSRGYEVIISNDEYPNNFVGKIMGKLDLPILKNITEKVITKNYINYQQYEKVLIIKGRGISPSVLKKLRLISKSIIAYNFDSFNFHNSPLKWYKLVDSYYTFDYNDADNYSLKIIELFSSLPIDNKSPKKIDFCVSAIMKNHSNRIKYLDSLLSVLKKENVYIYIYEPNMISFILNFVKNPLLYLKYWDYIFFKPLEYKKYVKVLEQSNFTLDYAHPKQSGITIRCFEALSVQTKIISNNVNVFRNKNFDNTNVLIYDYINPSKDLINDFKEMENHIPQKKQRTINNFLDELLS